ncbi:MAG TPA: hypothetical protein VN193_08415 [Candidatus Angelobacter sp.]|jgi:hypothetical protein|nr:hypothetical protein [Candidatus Angelobacter sp.]
MAVIAPRARPAGAVSPLSPGGRGPLAAVARLLASPPRVFLVAAALAAFAACVDVLHDPDLWWHLRLGQWILDSHSVPHTELFSFTAAGNAMTAHEWGSEVLFALMARVGGLLLVSLVMACVAWSGLLALALRARARGAGVVAVAVALLVGARAMEPVLGTRPQVITVALVCWTLLVAERYLARGGRLVWVLPPVVLVWANLHGGVVLGLGALCLLLALSALSLLLRRPGAPSFARLRTLGLAVGVAAAAGCLNPNGPGLYRYALATSASERLKPITEWHSPDFTDPSNLGLLILLVSFGALVAIGGRLSLRDLGMSLAGFAAALLAVRNTSLAVALSLPAWTSLLHQAITRFTTWRSTPAMGPGATPPHKEPPARRKPSRTAGAPPIGAQFLVAGAAIISLAATVSGIAIARAATDASPQRIATTYPTCAANALQSLDATNLIAPYYDSGYLIHQLWPQTHVYLYGESASLGQQVFANYARIYAGDTTAIPPSTTAILTPPGPLHNHLAESPTTWHQILNDPTGLTLFTTTPLPTTTC